MVGRSGTRRSPGSSGFFRQQPALDRTGLEIACSGEKLGRSSVMAGRCLEERVWRHSNGLGSTRRPLFPHPRAHSGTGLSSRRKSELRAGRQPAFLPTGEVDGPVGRDFQRPLALLVTARLAGSSLTQAKDKRRRWCSQRFKRRRSAWQPSWKRTPTSVPFSVCFAHTTVAKKLSARWASNLR